MRGRADRHSGTSQRNQVLEEASLPSSGPAGHLLPQGDLCVILTRSEFPGSRAPEHSRHPRRAKRGKGIQYGFNLLDSILDSLPLRASYDALRPGTTGMVFCPNASNRGRTELRNGPARGEGERVRPAREAEERSEREPDSRGTSPGKTVVGAEQKWKRAAERPPFRYFHAGVDQKSMPPREVGLARLPHSSEMGGSHGLRHAPALVRKVCNFSGAGVDQKSMPPMPPAGMAGAASFLGLSAIIASVVMSRPATEAASWRAQRTTLVGSMMPAAYMSP